MRKFFSERLHAVTFAFGGGSDMAELSCWLDPVASDPRALLRQARRVGAMLIVAIAAVLMMLACRSNLESGMQDGVSAAPERHPLILFLAAIEIEVSRNRHPS